MKSFVLIRGESDKEKKLLVAKVLSLLRCVVGGGKKSDKRAFVQFMECIPSLDSVGDAMEGVGLRWAATGGGENESDVNSLEGENNRTAGRERFGVTLFESTPSTAHVV